MRPFEAKVVADGSNGSGPLVVVTGEVDVATSPKLAETIYAALSLAPKITVDLSAVDFIDASGIGVLVGALDDARAEKRRLTIRRPSRTVKRVLQILELNDVLPIETG